LQKRNAAGDPVERTGNPRTRRPGPRRRSHGRTGKFAPATRCRAHAALTRARSPSRRRNRCWHRSGQQQQSLEQTHPRELTQAVEQRRAGGFVLHQPQRAGGIGNPGFAGADRAFAARARPGERANRRIAGAETVAGSDVDHVAQDNVCADNAAGWTQLQEAAGGPWERGNWREKTCPSRNCASASSKKYHLNLDGRAERMHHHHLCRRGPGTGACADRPEEMAGRRARPTPTGTPWGSRLSRCSRSSTKSAGEPRGHRGIRGNRAALPVPQQAARRPGLGQGATC